MSKVLDPKPVISASWNAYAVIILIFLLIFYGKYPMSFLASVLTPPLLIGSVIVQTMYLLESYKKMLINYLILVISTAMLVSLTVGYLTNLNVFIILITSIVLFNAQHYLTKPI